MADDTTLLTALAGISGILVTPFDAVDRIAPERLGPVVDRAVAAGVHVLVCNGNTSEFTALTLAEAQAMVEAVAELVAGRAPLLAGVGRGVGDAVTLAQTARKAGVAGLMVHQPPDPFAAPRGVVAYVQRIAEAGGGLPVVLYIRNDAIGLDAIAALCRIPEVIAVKWASPTPLRLAEAMRLAEPRIAWVAGLAETWAPPLYAVGARGFTSGLINVWPDHSVRIHAALDSGDYDAARGMIGAMRVFEDLRAEEGGGTNVAIVKAALAMLGMDCGPTRPPAAWPLSARQADDLRAALQGWGLTGPAHGEGKHR